MVAVAETLIGIPFTGSERDAMLEGLNQGLNHYEAIRGIKLANHVPPALCFDPRLPEGRAGVGNRGSVSTSAVPSLVKPSTPEQIAFLPVTHLAELIRTRQITSVALTELYLERLKRLGPRLECVVTLTQDLALAQAKRADDEIARDHYRGPLHGIPWGAKDLLATKGIATTWGATPYKDQVFDTDATVVQRLEEAGAVLVAKLAMGSLAYSDVWFGGKTRNPWNMDEGSGGSSAGPASATGAGLVGFAIGSETTGSIVWPALRCGTVGLRPDRKSTRLNSSHRL